MEPFIVDFLCREKKLIVEVDGDSHIDRKLADQSREDFLISAGYTVLRVSNDDVLHNLEGTLMTIVKSLGVDPGDWRDGKFGKVSE